MITEVKHHACSWCQRTNLRKNGYSAEKRQRYHGKDCNSYGTISEVAQKRAERYQQVEELLLERTSLRGIQHVTRVSRSTISKLIKKSRCSVGTQADRNRPSP